MPNQSRVSRPASILHEAEIFVARRRKQGVAIGAELGDKRVRERRRRSAGCGCSSGVEHNLAKVGVEGSNPFARSKISQ